MMAAEVAPMATKRSTCLSIGVLSHVAALCTSTALSALARQHTIPQRGQVPIQLPWRIERVVTSRLDVRDPVARGIL